MAEFAQRSIEEMLVEIEKMRKIGLFTHEETRAIMKKRKRFEYKMQRRTKEKDVYLQYIQYEIGVYKLIKMRREKKRIELGKDEIDKTIALRIYKLFRIACFRFKSDTKLWLTHIEFAKSNMDKERVSKIFTTMLQVHNKKPNLWIMAAKYELEFNESIETARHLFQRALRFLPNNPKIWIEYFKMELLCVELVMKRKELLGITDDDSEKIDGQDQVKKLKKEDSILSCKIVEVVFRSAIKQVQENIPDLIHSLILVAMKFKFANRIVDTMYNCLNEDEKLKKCEESWDVLARRHLLDEQEIVKKCADTGQVADFSIAEFEEKANDVFLTALSDLNTKRMNEIYIQFCTERLRLESKFLNEERFNRLNDAFKNANLSFGLSLEQTIEWIETLMKFDKIVEAKSIVEKSLDLETHKGNSKLWLICLKIKKMEIFKNNDKKELVDLFYKAIECVKPKNAFQIWELIIEWAFTNNYPQVEQLLKDGSHQTNKETSSFMRCKYLDWILEKQDPTLKELRDVYKSFRQVPPYDLNFFLKYIEIEKLTPRKERESFIEKAYEDALIHFGKNNIDIWLSYVDFEYTKTNKSTEYVAELYKRAMKQLENDLVEEFTQQFVLLKINLNNLIASKIKQVEID